jgi:hypothetical protein
MSSTAQTFTHQSGGNLHWLTMVVPPNNGINFSVDVVRDPGCTSIDSVAIEVYSIGVIECHFERYSKETPSVEFFLPTLEGVEGLRVRIPDTWNENQVIMVQRA